MSSLKPARGCDDFAGDGVAARGKTHLRRRIDRKLPRVLRALLSKKRLAARNVRPTVQ